MKNILILSLIICLPLSGLAKKVNPDQARAVATNFIRGNSPDSIPLPVIDQLSLVWKTTMGSTVPGTQTEVVPLIYAFAIGSESGYVLVAADDQVYPVLGYSHEGTFDPDNMHPGIRKWLEEYKKQIRDIIREEIPPTPEISAMWQQLTEDRLPSRMKGMTNVAPLVTTTWSQAPHVNALCPYDYANGGRSVTGCVATAMAQIMKFWNHPAQGSGFHSYNHGTFGTLSGNFGGSAYNWAAMPNEVNSQNDAVATLMYHCGVSVEMNYSAKSSGAWVIEDYSTVEHCSEYALKTYFNYQSSMQGIQRKNYYDSQWTNLLKTEINAGRPVLYAGFGPGGGHAFVCDGYNGDYFHFNWGWGGAYDGYFLTLGLNPTGVGTGGGSGSYNNNQQIIIGIQPVQQNSSFDLALYDFLTVNPTSIGYGNEFTAHFDVANYGTGTFNGEIAAAIFDSEINFVEFIEVISNAEMGPNTHFTDGLDFEYEGSFELLPGKYYLAALYKANDGNWMLLKNNEDYENFIEFEVQHDNDIELWADMTVSSGEFIVQGEAFSVYLDVANFGTNDFSGILDVSLYNLDGSLAETIEMKSNMDLCPNCHYTDGLSFSSSGIDLEPGTYLMALLHKHDGGDWELSGSSNFTNPEKIIVKVPPIPTDPYENNNSRATAFVFQPSYTNNYVHITTPGSSIHSGDNNDYYGINLQGGYTYTVSGRLHDSYSSANGNTYTNDVLVSLLLDDYTSDVYDDILPTFTITMYSTGLAYFNVAPYFAGQKGSYLLDLHISRVFGTGIEDIEITQSVKVYPNPAKDEIWLDLSDWEEAVSLIEILDLQGRRVMHWQDPAGNSGKYRFDIQTLAKGQYAIRAYGKEVHQTRFVKTP
ncbi:MAG: T9SS type A sorting domain-containing protein [Bacteroidetes bacterium]|jgi:hypothetical protein|nr:T9SS type A sorting domain-containing protein [Bacteroidota bacterium]MBT4398847.1 T9SS type A sorting domain-containing protein [Bacteroidota bacterium]MBT4410192.1 T9SS type A sorting domain-containing protein [Bacteroidota bacterium]MBT5426890.1 T9SS type A sorting domain-containing protein [Bacteroidota bacterium]MBT7465285.1 T9SS type A sorting domain-containing protein [Bacteroidota bacterium]